MAVRADRDPKYYRRFLLIGSIALGFALWSLYDGAVKYPHQRERALEFDRLMEEGRGNDWDAIAAERGWSPEAPGEPKSETDITMQYAMAALAGTIGLLVLLGVWRSRGRWIEGGSEGITSSWGQSFDYDRVVSLDKKQWQSKGIAKVTYEDAKGRRRRFVIDDYKFERDATDKILFDLETRIGPDRITGGPPEPLPEEYEESAPEAVR